MTQIIFVRHAEPQSDWAEDATRPLVPFGKFMAQKLPDMFPDIAVDAFYSSPYRRSVDTVTPWAAARGQEVQTDARLRERQYCAPDAYGDELLEKRWADFSFAEEGGECLAEVQTRNVAALQEILALYDGKTVVIGTHGTALSTMLHYYDQSFGCAGFRRIRAWLPYVVRVDFVGQVYHARKELFWMKAHD